MHCLAEEGLTLITKQAQALHAALNCQKKRPCLVFNMVYAWPNLCYQLLNAFVMG